MKTIITELEDKIVATLIGELDTAHAVMVAEELKPLHENKGKDILIDCAGLEYIASSGLRILLGILKSTKANGHKVTLKNLNDDIKSVFKMTGFIDLFDFE